MNKIILFIPFILSCVLGLSIFGKATESYSSTIPEINPNITVEHPLQKKSFTLFDCYQLALKQSEQIAISQQSIKEAQGRFYQSLSGILPDISYVVSEQREYGRDFANKERDRKFTFSQPLFSGFKEFAAIAVSRAEKKQRLQEKKRAEELLFIDVSDAFYFYLTYQDQQNTLGAVREALVKRVDELKRREELGRSRSSEVASAQARLSRVEADVQEVLANQDVAQQLLEFLIGQTFDSLADQEHKLSFDQLDMYLKKVKERADVKASYEAWQSAVKKISVARADFMPLVTADGNYYDQRDGNSSNVDWDILLKMEVPLFRGMENVGAYKEAKAISNQEELTYQETRRKAILDIQNSYSKFQRAIQRQEALRKSFEAAEYNYKLQTEDYEKNLVDNLDVLQALEDFETAQRDYKTAYNETKRLYWNLKVATGEIYDSI